MSLLVDLVDDVTRHILSCWLWSEDVIKLDNAACSIAIRPKLLRVMNGLKLKKKVDMMRSACQSSSFMQWAAARNIRPGALKLDSWAVTDSGVAEDTLKKMVMYADVIRVSDSYGIGLVADYATDVEKLRIRPCDRAAMATLFSRPLVSVRTLVLSGCLHDFAPTLRSLSSAVPNQTHLDVHSTCISCKQVAYFLKNCPKLTSLDCTFCPNIGSALLTTRTSYPNLHTLKIAGTDLEILDNEARLLAQTFPSLTELTVTYASNDALVTLAKATRA